MKVGCPTCGAEVEFRYDDSFVRVCGSCRAAVVRADRGVETLGQLADLVPTGSPLALFADGRWGDQGFLIVGRAQYRHPAGGVWDEWYAKLDDGRWGWLAEAQGRFYLTFETVGAGEPPPWSEVFPGATVQLEDDGPRLFTVGERGVAELIAAAGEIPFRFQPGARSAFADLGDGTGRFATLDYGDPDDDDRVTIYLGRQVTLDELRVTGGEAAAPAAGPAPAQRLSCPQCGGAVDLRAPDRSMRVVCGYCSSLLDCEGPLAVLGKLAQDRPEGPIALGATARFDDVDYTVIGRLRRRASSSYGVSWTEYLLYQPRIGFRWLVEADGHWSLITTLPPGAVETESGGVDADAPRYRGQRFRLYDRGEAEVVAVWGELYWRVAAGETVTVADYIAPPASLSCEQSDDEVNWSLGVYLTPRQVRAAFGLDEALPAPVGVGMIQPFRHRHVGLALMGLAAAVLLATCARSSMASKRVVLDQRIEVPAAPPEAGAPAGPNALGVVFTEPFQLHGDENVEVRLGMPLDNRWAYIAADLVNDETGDVESFEREVSHYSGVSGGERWSEGSPWTTAYLPAVPAGRYVLRLEIQQPPTGWIDAVDVRVRQDVFRMRHLYVTLGVVLGPGLLLALWYWWFERRRWSSSDHAPAGLRSGDDDD